MEGSRSATPTALCTTENLRNGLSTGLYGDGEHGRLPHHLDTTECANHTKADEESVHAQASTPSGNVPTDAASHQCPPTWWTGADTPYTTSDMVSTAAQVPTSGKVEDRSEFSLGNSRDDTTASQLVGTIEGASMDDAVDRMPAVMSSRSEVGPVSHTAASSGRDVVQACELVMSFVARQPHGFLNHNEGVIFGGILERTKRQAQF